MFIYLLLDIISCHKTRPHYKLCCENLNYFLQHLNSRVHFIQDCTSDRRKTTYFSTEVIMPVAVLKKQQVRPWCFTNLDTSFTRLHAFIFLCCNSRKTVIFEMFWFLGILVFKILRRWIPSHWKIYRIFVPFG
jgi:hypothetical protein